LSIIDLFIVPTIPSAIDAIVTTDSITIVNRHRHGAPHQPTTTACSAGVSSFQVEVGQEADKRKGQTDGKSFLPAIFFYSSRHIFLPGESFFPAISFFKLAVSFFMLGC
jgi:hypothetical protein